MNTRLLVAPRRALTLLCLATAASFAQGVQSLIAKGYIDSRHMGIEGQSWGGYQSAYLITVTNMFAAAAPNAAVVNMTSARDAPPQEGGVRDFIQR